jgi:leucyl aminopeptidase
VNVEWRLLAQPGADTDLVVLPVVAGNLPDAVPEQERRQLADFLARTGFTGAPGEVAFVPGRPGEPATALLGHGPATVPDSDAVRRAAAGLARRASRFSHLAIAAAGDAKAGDIRALVEGYLLGGYRYSGHHRMPAANATQYVDVIASGTEPASAALADLTAALATGREFGMATLTARDLVNEPGGTLTPTLFAQQAAKAAAESGLECEVWQLDRLRAEQTGGLLGVTRGSLEPPALLHLTYRPAAYQRRIALVGKGVTFDAGGISIKPNAQMVDMKADMAGAAAVLGAMTVLAGRGCAVAVDGWLPLTENMVNADPVRIGDVLRIRGGTTVEVRNADAEGRLIMADALVLASETRPDAIIDIATLTDAAAIALGRKIAAVMGTDEALEQRLVDAGRRAGEPLWRLPLPEMYRRQLDSRVADLVNYTIGTRHGTALLAGLFLREFVPPDIPWAHLDIQGTALCDAEDGEWVAGATGFGVRTLADFLLAEAAVA